MWPRDRGALVPIYCKWEQLCITWAGAACIVKARFFFFLFFLHLHNHCTSHFHASFWNDYPPSLLPAGLVEPPRSRHSSELDCVSPGGVSGFFKRYVCAEQLSCQSSQQWQFCSRASARPSTFLSESLSLRNRGQRDDGWWKSLTGKYSIEGVRCTLWQWAHSGGHNTLPRVADQQPVRVTQKQASAVPCSRQPAAVQSQGWSPRLEKYSYCLQPNQIRAETQDRGEIVQEGTWTVHKQDRAPKSEHRCANIVKYGWKENQKRNGTKQLEIKRNVYSFRLIPSPGCKTHEDATCCWPVRIHVPSACLLISSPAIRSLLCCRLVAVWVCLF